MNRGVFMYFTVSTNVFLNKALYKCYACPNDSFDGNLRNANELKELKSQYEGLPVKITQGDDRMFVEVFSDTSFSKNKINQLHLNEVGDANPAYFVMSCEYEQKNRYEIHIKGHYTPFNEKQLHEILKGMLIEDFILSVFMAASPQSLILVE